MKASGVIRSAAGDLPGTLPAADALAPNVIGKRAAPFIAQTQRITRAYLEALGKDVTHFCRMYDYRNKGQDFLPPAAKR